MLMRHALKKASCAAATISQNLRRAFADRQDAASNSRLAAQAVLVVISH